MNESNSAKTLWTESEQKKDDKIARYTVMKVKKSLN